MSIGTVNRHWTQDPNTGEYTYIDEDIKSGLSVGKDDTDCGDIFIGKESVKGVFMTRYVSGEIEDRLIWPIQSKYRFFATDKEKVNEVFSDTNFERITVEPNAQDITIYVRSCALHYRTKYRYYVTSFDDWVQIDKTSLKSGEYIEKNPTGESTKKVADSTFTISIDPNYKFSTRKTTIDLYQYDQNTGVATGKTYTFEIIQKADYELDGRSFENSEIQWYKDGAYDTLVTDYSEVLANAENGTTTLYFRIPGYVNMASGLKNQSCWYGEKSDEKIDITNFSYQSSNKHIQASLVNQIEEGKWYAKIDWDDNVDYNMNSEITSAVVNGAPFGPQGGVATLSFYIYRTSSTEPRGEFITLTCAKAISTIKLCQNGIEKKSPVTVDKLSDISISYEGDKDIQVDTSTLSVDSSNRYSCLVYCYSGINTSNILIEDIKFGGYKNSDVKIYTAFPYLSDGNLPVVCFQINYYAEFKPSAIGKIQISYDGDVKILDVSRKEEKGDKEIISSLDNIKDVNTDYSNLAFNWVFNGVGVDWVKFATSEDDYSIPTFINEEIGWIRGLQIEDNPMDTSKKDDIIVSDLSFQYAKETGEVVSACAELEHYEYPNDFSKFETQPMMVFRLRSGEIDSKERGAYIVIGLNGISEETSGKSYAWGNQGYLIQRGSNEAKDFVFKDIDVNTIDIVNTTDNLNCGYPFHTSLDDGYNNEDGYWYKCFVHIKENPDYDETSTAYVKPVKIENSSVGTLNNDLYGMVYLQIYGYKVYKGVFRDVSFEIKNENVETKTTSILQKECDTVPVDKTDLAPVEGLSLPSISLVDGSEGEIVSTEYTSNLGWYTVKIKVTPNDVPTKKIANLSINNSLHIFNGEWKNNTLSVDSLSYKYPIRFWWYVTGVPVTRTVTLKVEDIEETVTEYWNNVPFSGQISIRDTYKIDWGVSYEEDTWLRVDDYHNLIINQNTSETSRSKEVSFIPMENGEEVTFDASDTPASSPFVIKVNQSEYEDTSKHTLSISNMYKEITAISENGNWQENIILFTAYEEVSCTKDKVEVTCTHNGENITISDVFIYSLNYSDVYGTKTSWISLKCKTSTSNGSYVFTIANTLGNTIEFTLDVPEYYIDVNEVSEVKLDYENNRTEIIPITSAKDGSIEYYTLENFPSSWASYNKNSIGSEVSLITKNTSEKNNVSNIKVMQTSSGKYCAIKLMDTNYRDAQINNSDVDFTDVKRKGKTFYSEIDEKYSEVSYELVNSTLDSDVTFTITQGSKGTQGNIAINNNYILVDEESLERTKQQAIVYVKNQDTKGNSYTIGKFNVIRHAYHFGNCTKETPGTMNITISETAETLYSQYYITSHKDKIFIDFEVTDCSNELYVNKNGNILYVYPLETNDSGSQKQYAIQLTQKESGLIINCNVYQNSK